MVFLPLPLERIVNLFANSEFKLLKSQVIFFFFAWMFGHLLALNQDSELHNSMYSV